MSVSNCAKPVNGMIGKSVTRLDGSMKSPFDPKRTWTDRLFINRLYSNVQGGGVILIRSGLLAFVIVVALAGTARAQSDLVKRGDYLVNGIMTCGNCHTPKGPSGDIKDKAFSGGLS